MECRLFGAEAGIGANDKFVELLLGAALASEKSAKNRGEETERDADNAGIGQRKERCSLNKMALGGGDVRGVNAHDRRTKNDEQDTGSETCGESPNRSRRCKAAPENAQHDHREICAGGDGECQADKKSHVDRLKLDREEYREGADDESGDAGDAYFLTWRPFPSMVNNVGVEIVREGGAR